MCLVLKFDSKTFKGIFLSYSLDKTAFRMYVIDQQKITESTNVTFDDYKFLSMELENENCENQVGFLSL